MADLTVKQQRNQLSSPSVRPDREKFSADQLASMDAADRGHQAALADPTLNGQDAGRRYQQGAGGG
jgi:hypothetical protein